MPGLQAKPKPIFRGVVVAQAADLGEKNWDEASLTRYLKSWGGRFSHDLDDSVTHLLATTKQFKSNGSRIREARKRKNVDILSKDWLEDSMIKGRKLCTKEYSLLWRSKATKAKKRGKEKAAKGVEQAERFINTNLYHPYRDETFFQYDIRLEKGDAGERYQLTLFESTAEPPLYHTAAKYFLKKGAKPMFWKGSKVPGSLEQELKPFTYLFGKKTGIQWDDRMEEAQKNGGKVGKNGMFCYKPPTGGKPVGLVNGVMWNSAHAICPSPSTGVQSEPFVVYSESTNSNSRPGVTAMASTEVEELVLTQLTPFLDQTTASNSNSVLDGKHADAASRLKVQASCPQEDSALAAPKEPAPRKNVSLARQSAAAKKNARIREGKAGKIAASGAAGSDMQSCQSAGNKRIKPAKGMLFIESGDEGKQGAPPSTKAKRRRAAPKKKKEEVDTQPTVDEVVGEPELADEADPEILELLDNEPPAEPYVDKIAGMEAMLEDLEKSELGEKHGEDEDENDTMNSDSDGGP